MYVEVEDTYSILQGAGVGVLRMVMVKKAVSLPSAFFAMHAYEPSSSGCTRGITSRRLLFSKRADGEPFELPFCFCHETARAEQ